MNSIDDQIKECKDKIAEYEFHLAVERKVLERLTVISKAQKISGTNEPRPIIPDSIVPHITSALRKSGKAMRITELATEIQRQNVTIDGKTKPKRLISSALTRRKDLFERVGRGMYKLKTEENTIPIQEVSAVGEK